MTKLFRVKIQTPACNHKWVDCALPDRGSTIRLVKKCDGRLSADVQTKAFVVARAMLVAAVFGIVGCAHGPDRSRQLGDDASIFSMDGTDTRIAFDFQRSSTTQPSPATQRRDQDLYIIKVGDAFILCTQRGSALVFGPDDGQILVSDSPAYGLEPNDPDPSVHGFMQVISTVYLIAGSVDRLPEALGKYLDDPGPHRLQALKLATQLLHDGGAAFEAEGSGGNFTVIMLLTESGRQKLSDAIQEHPDSDGIYSVSEKRTMRSK